MKRIYINIVFFILAQNSFAQVMTLHDAINIAIKNSQSVQIAKNGVDAATIYNSYGIAGGLPLVTATGSDINELESIRQKYSTPANDKSSNNSNSNSLAAGVNVSELVFNDGRVVTAKKRLGVIESQSKQLLDSRVLTVMYNVMLKYYDILRQESYATTLERSIDVSKQKLDIVKTQQSVGMANDADLFQSEVDLNTQLQNMQAQQLVIVQDKTDLMTLLNLRPDSAIIIADTIAVDSTVKLDAVLQDISSNPDIVAADQQVTINQYISKETGALRYPSLSVSGIYTLSRVQNAAGFSLLNENFGPYVGVGVTIPIFNGNIYKKEQQVADINIKTASLVKDTLVLSYNSNAVKSWEAYQNNLQQLQTASQNYLLSQKLLDLVIERFKVREATIVDVKNAQQSFEDAGNIMVNISYAAKVAEIQLKRLANKLTP